MLTNQSLQNIILGYRLNMAMLSVYLLLANNPIFHNTLAITVITQFTEKSNVMCGIFH